MLEKPLLSYLSVRQSVNILEKPLLSNLSLRLSVNMLEKPLLSYLSVRLSVNMLVNLYFHICLSVICQYARETFTFISICPSICQYESSYIVDFFMNETTNVYKRLYGIYSVFSLTFIDPCCCSFRLLLSGKYLNIPFIGKNLI